MKTRMIELKSIDVDGQKDAMIYRQWLVNVMARPANPQAGMKLDEQRKILPVMDLIDPQGVDIQPTKVHLTVEQHALVMEKIKAFDYPGFNRLFINFEADIEGAPEVEMTPTEDVA